MPHPYLVPVSPACSRRAQRRCVSPSTFRSTDLPFTVSLATFSFLRSSAQFRAGASVLFLLSAFRLGQRQRLRKRLPFTFARAGLSGAQRVGAGGGICFGGLANRPTAIARATYWAM